MHPDRSFFTRQNLSIAICPYRVMSVPEFTEGMQSLGYRVVDHWQSPERHLRVPFEPGCTVDRYHGFPFELDAWHHGMERRNRHTKQPANRFENGRTLGREGMGQYV